jgi:hypothetical protein
MVSAFCKSVKQAHKEVSTRVVKYMCIWESTEIQTQTHWILVGGSDRPAACVFAQQYSSVTFVSLGLHYREVEFVVFLKIFFPHFFHFEVA